MCYGFNSTGMEIDKWVKSEEVENNGLKRKKIYEGCIRCLELYDKITKSDDNCIRLELDIVKKNTTIQSLEGKLGFMGLKNLKIENEFRMLKQRNEELENSIRNRKEEDDKLALLLIENNVLECEKKKAEIDMGAWKAKCKELEIQVMELEKKLSNGVMNSGGPSAGEPQNKANENIVESGTHPMNSPPKQYKVSEGIKGGRKCESKPRVRNRFTFGGEGSPHNTVSPSTPGIRHPFVSIEISDSDEDDVNTKYVDNSSDVGLGVSPDGKKITLIDVEAHSHEEKNTCYNESPSCYPMPKRRTFREGVASYVVTTDSESDSDDNIPIGSLRTKKASGRNLYARRNDSTSEDNREKRTPRRRLKRMGENEDNGCSGICHNESSEDGKHLETPVVLNDYLSEDEMEKDDSCSEGESLGGFIVDSSDASESDSDDGKSSGDCLGDPENGSEYSVGYGEVMSSLRRERKGKTSWEFEADMLADLSKYPELCMKGVCAIYRRQTSEEKCCQATMFVNGRGFSQCHASIGSDLAEFLTDGDPYGDVKKSVEELEEFYLDGVKECRKLATHYSRQLFEIYQGREDPFFHP